MSQIDLHLVHEGDLAAVAADSLDAGLAVIDPTGKITWANAAWHESQQGVESPDPSAGATTLADLTAGARGVAASAIEKGIRSVIEGDSAHFQLEYHARTRPPRHYVLTATPLRGESRGAVIMRRRARTTQDAREIAIGGGRSGAVPPVDRLTPREFQILTLLARGLPNRAIARELQIEYTTVRGYVQSLIEKFGASSRIEAVAMAYRWGMVE
jgi:DNA-binding NarL/FixJ family response regulator